MKSCWRERCIVIGRYMVENQCTVRKAAEFFEVSKSTVHKDVAQRLEYLDRSLYYEVRSVLRKNKAQRHLRGGEATRKKFLKQKLQKQSK